MFTHTFREGNKIADWMAMQGAISSTHLQTCDVCPPQLASLLVADVLGNLCPGLV